MAVRVLRVWLARQRDEALKQRRRERMSASTEAGQSRTARNRPAAARATVNGETEPTNKKQSAWGLN